jgi:7-cyano-7-deazaguanine synthase
MADSVVIVSGGMDSVTLLHHIVKTKGHQPVVLTFHYGQKHVREIDYALFHVQQLKIREHSVVDLAPIRAMVSSSALVGAMPLPTLDEVRGNLQPATYVPNRNMLFLAIAAACAENLGVHEVYYGAQRHDMYGYWDTTQDFLQRLNHVYALNRKTPIQILAPFVDFSKADILRLGTNLGVDYAKTWSCYAGQSAACGVCPTCGERLAAFAEVGIKDPIPYLEHPS